MDLSKEQLRIAEMIDAKVQRLVQEGNDDITILGEMVDCMSGFKELLDSGHGTMDELCRRFAGLYHYAKILETVATGIQSGTIQVPK
jgi:hypothetical protein